MAERILSVPGIYAIRNISDGKIYIGQSIRISKRIATHKWMLANGRHSCRHLQRAYDIHGAASFEFFLIEQCEIELLTKREQYWMDQHSRAGLYNSSPAAGSNSGFRHSEETIRKMSESRKGMPGIKTRLGKTNTPEARAAVAMAMTGRRVSDETRLKQSLSRKGGKLSDEHKAKIAASMMGREITVDWRARISEANKGRVVSAETREKLRQANIGKKQSQELIDRRIAASVAAKKAKRIKANT